MIRTNRPRVAAGISLCAAAALVLLSAQGAFADSLDAGAASAPALSIGTPTGVPTDVPATVPTDSPADDISSADPTPTPAPAAGGLNAAVTPAIPLAGFTNTPPVAVDDAYTAQEDSTLVVAAPGVLSNDTDADGDTVTMGAITAWPQHGLLVGTGSSGKFKYVPYAGYVGPDSFQYWANDGQDQSLSPATVSISVGFDPQVNHAPVANDDFFNATKNTPLAVAAPGLFANDTDLDGNPIVEGDLSTPPSHGSIGTIGSTGTFTYTPDAGFSGQDSFTYFASDGSLYSNYPAHVYINVGSGVESPPVSVDDSYSAVSGTPLVVPAPGILANDTDNGGPVNATDTIDIPFSPKHGSLVSQKDGSFVYTPAAGFVGTDSFSYIRSDGISSGNSATVTVSVSAAPVVHEPIANNDSYSTTKDTVLSVTGPGILANDADPDGHPIIQTKLFAAPSHGTLTALGNDGGFSYTPNAGFVGVDAFGYTIFDGTSWDTVPGFVSITVGAEAEQPPVSVDDSYSVTAGSTLQVGAPGYLSNDTQYGKPITVWSSLLHPSGVSHATLNTDTAGGFTYTPDAGFSGTDSFTYVISDGIASGNVATVTITVDAVTSGDPCLDGAGRPIPGCGTGGSHHLAYTGADAAPSLLTGGSLLLLGLLTAAAASWRRRRARREETPVAE